MAATTRFLVIDMDKRRRLLVVATLERHFPHAHIVEAEDKHDIRFAVEDEDLTAVVGMAAGGADALSLVQLIRELNPQVPILMMTDSRYREAIIAQGATAFLRAEEWLLAGTALARAIQK